MASSSSSKLRSSRSRIAPSVKPELKVLAPAPRKTTARTAGRAATWRGARAAPQCRPDRCGCARAGARSAASRRRPPRARWAARPAWSGRVPSLAPRSGAYPSLQPVPDAKPHARDLTCAGRGQAPRSESWRRPAGAQSGVAGGLFLPLLVSPSGGGQPARWRDGYKHPPFRCYGRHCPLFTQRQQPYRAHRSNPGTAFATCRTRVKTLDVALGNSST